VILSADAVGIAAECTRSAAEYAKERIQFGRPIAMFQAVKHHCANMAVATEMATAATWDAARAAATGGDQLSYTAAVAATLAAPAADLCANLNTQVHGGIAITWEHEAHLYLRRATTLLHFLDADGAAADLVDLARRGVTRAKTVELPPEAETIRADVRAFVDELADLSEEEQKAKLVETGYAMPHWPKPYGRAAGPIEQLVIEQEFGTAKVTRPSYGITGWNILTLIQYGTEDQVAALGEAGARPGGRVVPAVLRARRRLRRRRRHDQGHPGGRRLAGQRPEGVDLRRPLLGHGLRHRAHQPGRPQA
jgi:alkylation response protein AidB-like acyl-CoA dehydrogenase